MKHPADPIRLNLHFPENDTKAKAFCGPTSLMAITGRPFSVVRDACRMARYGMNWPSKFERAPNVRGVSNAVLERAFRILGYSGRWVEVPNRPTLAAWLDNRTDEERKKPCVVNVTGHYVTVAGFQFVDTFTKGQVVEIDEAPHRRKRVTRVFIIIGRVAPTPVVSKQPARSSDEGRVRQRELSRTYRAFASYARGLGASWHKERGDTELEIRLADGRRLTVTHSLPDDWCGARDQLEEFLSTPTPDPELFEDGGDGDWYALTV